jgi:hypothetical protein
MNASLWNDYQKLNKLWTQLYTQYGSTGSPKVQAQLLTVQQQLAKVTRLV